MEIKYSNSLKINKLTQAQFNATKTAGNIESDALYLTPEQPVTFTSSGGASAGATYDGSAAVTVSYKTVGAAAQTHYHGSNYINAMTSYSKGSSTAAISTSDTLNNAMGKLESRLDNAVTLTVTNNNPTASWGSAVNIGTVAGTTLSFTMPSQPSNTSDGKVTQTQVSSSSYNHNYPLLMAATSTSVTSTQKATTYKNYNKLYANPYSGQLTATTFNALSDRRLKENLIPYQPEKSILDLPVYKYNFIADETKVTHLGCLAQDLQVICPEIVSEDTNGYLSIIESKIVYLLLAEVKKLRSELDHLKEEKN